MIDDTPEGIGNDSPLSISEAASAYASVMSEEEAPEGHAESEQPLEGEEAAPEQSEDGAEQEEAEDETTQEEPPAPAYVPDDGKVKLSDGTEMTVAELSKGYFRDRDYRQKSMELGEQRRSFETKAQQIQQLDQQLSTDREFMVQLMQSIMPQRPDPSMLSADPVGYQEMRAHYDIRKEQLDYLLQQTQQEATRRQEAQNSTIAEKRTAEWAATLDAMPELKDSTKLRAFADDVKKHGVEDYRFSPQELGALADDHRLAMVLRDAIAFRKLQTRKAAQIPAKVEGKPPVQRGGNRPTPDMQKARDVKAAMTRLNQSGSIKDGVAALLALEQG